ncbi:hypothetical protein Tco_0977298 [Tanacetum coccineum]|uniref:Uncharacterized protein n=1 Tax=Tanacetum coccineum TaxID=301880 RepID=A0ABQ5EJP7_9ASTR
MRKTSSHRLSDLPSVGRTTQSHKRNNFVSHDILSCRSQKGFYGSSTKDISAESDQKDKRCDNAKDDNGITRKRDTRKNIASERAITAEKRKTYETSP